MSTFKQGMGMLFMVVICFGVAWIGSIFTISSVNDWYVTLKKPLWNPPSWLFGPVWTALYMLMAVAAWIVWRQAGQASVVIPLAIFGIQLSLNLAWSIIFFGRHEIGLAMIDIMLLWLAILATIIAFKNVNPIAGWLLVPYLLWVTFAGALNFTIWQLNR
ncbi:MAG: TspO/MBR family protein [Armatimonadota bacterium]